MAGGSAGAVGGLALPREHGAWVMLGGSLAVGLAAARPPVDLALLAAAVVLAGFVTQENLRRRRAAAWPLAAVCALAAVTLVWLAGSATPAVGLAAAGALMTWQRTAGRRHRMTVGGQVLSTAGLALPAVIASRDPWLAFLAWAACWLFYLGPVFNVRMLLGRPEQRRALARANLLATTLIALGVLLLGLWPTAWPWAEPMAFLPLPLRLIWSWQRRNHRPALKAVGLVETAATVWFVAWTALWLFEP